MNDGAMACGAALIAMGGPAGAGIF